MKKIIFVFTLVLVIAIVSGYTISLKNEKAVENTKPLSIDDNRNNSNAKAIVSSKESQSAASEKMPESKTEFLIPVNNDIRLPGWSPSLRWNYNPAGTNRDRC
jgi:hypothetical protein